ncbi:MAG: pilus assembly protein PilM [Vulcanimicrobiota bacterium]
MFRKKVVVGLDLGSYSLQWAAIEPRSNACYVWRKRILSERSSKHDRPDHQSLQGRLRALLATAERETPVWNTSVVAGIQGQSVICGYLEFPELTKKELEVAVLSGVTREIPFPIETMEVSHLPVAALKEGKTGVFYSTWRRADAQRLHSLLGGCDIKIKRLEATGVALTRELFRNRKLEPQAFYLIIHVGFELTQFIAVRGGYPYYLRDIPVGGQDVTYAIQIGAQTSWQDAEELKHQYPIEELVFAAGPLFREWSYELKRSLKYFKRRYHVAEVAGVFLSGGSSLLQGLPEWLSSELGVPVQLDGWSLLNARQSDDEAPCHKIAVGLALGQ